MDEFGVSVAISGNYAIVTSDAEDHDADGNNEKSNAGSAYIFERNTNGTWNQIKKIVASDRAAGDGFGYSVNIDGNYVIAGAWRRDSQTGLAYIFKG